MARKSISNLVVGDNVRLKFHGNSSYGNAAHEEEYTFLGFDLDELGRRAAFGDHGGTVDFEAYFHQNRWRYGSSAEMLSIAEML